ncbi:MAG: restriction endonuclease [Sphaerochaeta sp.]
MAIPKYDEIQFEALKLLKDGIPRKAKEFIEPLSEVFQLTDVDLNAEYESGNGFVFADRISWALSYLNMAGLVTKPKRGIYQISEQGLIMLSNPSKFKQYVTKKYKEKIGKVAKPADESVNKFAATNTDMTPEEALYSSYSGIKESLYQEILETILSKTPREFEKIVVMLLQSMGYGGEVKDAGIVTQYSNDKGIDGVIKEDILGFGRVCIQAKKYALGHSVPREELQKFAGALMQAQSTKGVFITTSDFTKGAYEYVHNLNSSIRIIPINGKELAEYIFEYNLGMQTEKVIEIKRLDGDFWDGMQDEAKDVIPQL